MLPPGSWLCVGLEGFGILRNLGCLVIVVRCKWALAGSSLCFGNSQPKYRLGSKSGRDMVFILKITVQSSISFLPDYKTVCSYSTSFCLKQDSLVPLICCDCGIRRSPLICILIAEHLMTVEPSRNLAKGGSLCIIWHWASLLVVKNRRNLHFLLCKLSWDLSLFLLLLINVRLKTSPVIASWHQDCLR